MRASRVLAPLTALAAAFLANGCGGGGPPASAPPAADAAASQASGGLKPCELLSTAQVASVLGEASAGMTAQAGGSLIEGVDAYQCSYTNAAGDLLTVILNVAVDDARFAQITPGSEVRENRQPVEVGDGGWMSVEAGEVKVKAIRGRTVIDVELMASGAADRAPKLIGVTQAVAAKVQ